MLGWGLTWSKIPVREVAILNNFAWNDLWTFGHISIQQKRPGQRIKRFLKFNAICSAGLILSVLILNVEFNSLHMNRYWANLIAIMIVTLWNYFTQLEIQLARHRKGVDFPAACGRQASWGCSIL